MYKLIASDVDGTILPDYEVATFRTKKAVQLARSVGCAVILSTGRRVASTDVVANTLGISDYPMISHCGAVVSIPAEQRILKATHIDIKIASKVAEIALEHGAYVSILENVYQGRRIFQAPYLHYERTVAYNSWYGSFCRCFELCELDGFEDPIQLSILGKTEPVKRAYEKVRRLFPDTLKYVDYGVLSSGNYVVDIFAQGVSKASGIQTVMNLYDITKHECVAFGDGVNDLEILSMAGLPVAMENAPKFLKDKALRIAPPNNEDGVAHVIEDLYAKNLLCQI